MKHNAEKAMNLIQQALSLTGDFALGNARSYLLAALREINHVHNKRKKREFNLKQEYEQKERLSLEEAKKRLKALDEMIKIEEEEINQPRN